jgi:hypothetical protein
VRYIRSIKVAYRYRDIQIIGYWIYARKPYLNFSPTDLDELDLDIFKQLKKKGGGVAMQWQDKETDLSWGNYKHLYPNVRPLKQQLLISPIIPEQEHEALKGKKFKQYKHVLHFLPDINRTNDDPEMYATVPIFINAFVHYKLTDELSSSYEPYF